MMVFSDVISASDVFFPAKSVSSPRGLPALAGAASPAPGLQVVGTAAVFPELGKRFVDTALATDLNLGRYPPPAAL
jgi:hypothetical protein